MPRVDPEITSPRDVPIRVFPWLPEIDRALQTMASQLMRSGVHPPPPIDVSNTVSRSVTTGATVDEAPTPKQCMAARKLAGANAHMQQVSLHVNTHRLVSASVRARKQQMIAGSIGPLATANAGPAPGQHDLNGQQRRELSDDAEAAVELQDRLLLAQRRLLVAPDAQHQQAWLT
jgi:hypothetical protein